MANNYGNGKRSKKRKAAAKTRERVVQAKQKVTAELVNRKLKQVKEIDTPEQICAWLARSRHARTEPDKLQPERPLSRRSSSATGSVKNQFESKAPHNNPQCALGYNVD